MSRHTGFVISGERKESSLDWQKNLVIIREKGPLEACNIIPKNIGIETNSFYGPFNYVIKPIKTDSEVTSLLN